MLTYLCTVYPSRIITDELIETYWQTLKKYSDDEIREAGFKYLEQAQEKTPYPKPGDISARITQRSTESQSYIIEKGHTCSVCWKKNCMCIIEKPDTPSWTCRECYTGMDIEEIRQRYKDITDKIGEAF